MPPTTSILLPRQHPAPHLTPLPVLLEAQRIATARGQILDIQALMSPAQREEYRSSIGLPGKNRDDEEEEQKEDEREKEGEKEAEKGKEGERVDGHEATPTDTPAPSDPASVTASPAPAARKPFKMPDLSHLHWKQRQKRLAHIAREQELLAKGQITEMSIFTEDGVPQPKTRTKEKLLTNTEKEAIRDSASYWNNLLLQARRQRVPQWDYSTQQQQFERHSKDYYTHGLSPPPTPLSKKRKLSSTDTEGVLPNGTDRSQSNEGVAPGATPGSASSHMQGSGRLPSVTPTSAHTPLQPSTTPGSHPGQPNSARSNSLSLPPGFSGHNAPPGNMPSSLMAGISPSQMGGGRADGYSQGMNGLAMRGMGPLGQHPGHSPNPSAPPGSVQGVPSFLGLNNMGSMQGMQGMQGIQAAQALQAQGRLPPNMVGMPGLSVMQGQGQGMPGGQGPMLSGGWRRE
ncbi:hypothetical protein IAR50_001169 [Cryptococcus sp. DSM 104548]